MHIMTEFGVVMLLNMKRPHLLHIPQLLSIKPIKYIYIYIYCIVKKSDLIVHINGSNQKIPNIGFELDVQGSFDPDNRNLTNALTYTWTCEEILHI